MKNQSNKVSHSPKKERPVSKATPVNSRSDARKPIEPQSGRVRRTPDGTVEENSEEAAP